MSTITTILPTPPNGFSTQISTSSVSSSDLSIELDSTSGLGTEGVGQLLKKDADGNLVAGSVEFVHWTNVSGNTITFSDTGDRGITGSDSGAQSYVADDYFEVWVSSYYTPSGIREQINDTNKNELVKFSATASAVNEITITNAATGNAPEISATGGDTNIDVKIAGKGTGHLQAYDNTSASYFDVVPNSSMARQAIMNGNFDVWQRGTSVAVTQAAGIFQADRWYDFAEDDGGTAPTLTRSRQLIASGGIDNSYFFTRLVTDGAGTSLGNNTQHTYNQKIEHGTRNLCGDGKTVTISFWARSDITNKRLGLSLVQNYGTTGSPSADEKIISVEPITLTSTWTQYTRTFTTNTLSGKTFGTDLNDYLRLKFYYAWGSTIGNTDVYAGVSAETYVGAGYVDIAQVQLCAGEVALPFQPKSYAQELADCQRYCIAYGGSGVSTSLASGFNYSTTIAQIVFQFPQTMRSNPTVTATAADWKVAHTNTSTDVTSLVISSNSASPRGVILSAQVASGLTAGQASALVDDGTGNRLLYFEAEL